jgi:hypothetical protein
MPPTGVTVSDWYARVSGRALQIERVGAGEETGVRILDEIGKPLGALGSNSFTKQTRAGNIIAPGGFSSQYQPFRRPLRGF